MKAIEILPISHAKHFACFLKLKKLKTKTPIKTKTINSFAVLESALKEYIVPEFSVDIELISLKLVMSHTLKLFELLLKLYL